MTDVPSAAPALSPGFARARRLSGVLGIALAAGFWLGVTMAPSLGANAGIV